MATTFEEHLRTGWYKDAYLASHDIDINHELVFRGHRICPGDKIKFSNNYGLYKFRCIAHNVQLDRTWIDCIDCVTGEYRSFYLCRLRGPVVKRSYKRKVMVA